MRKPGRSSEIPPPLELECLKALWRLGNGNVKDVRDVLTENRSLAYTTVMTVLDRLVRRGAVERRKDGRAFVYSAVLDREHARRLAVKELVETYFSGSEQALRAYLDHPAAVPEPRHAEAHASHTTLDTTLL